MYLCTYTYNTMVPLGSNHSRSLAWDKDFRSFKKEMMIFFSVGKSLKDTPVRPSAGVVWDFYSLKPHGLLHALGGGLPESL